MFIGIDIMLDIMLVLELNDFLFKLLFRKNEQMLHLYSIEMIYWH